MSGSRAGGEDPGLQAERTLLSWQRTVASLVVVAALYLRDPGVLVVAGTHRQVDGRLLVVGLLLAAAGVLIAVLRVRWRRTRHGVLDHRTGAPPAPLAPPWLIVAVSGIVVGLGVAVLADVGLGWTGVPP
ncbi:DUF202 domain-containing protein [Lipingzhangella sp. LS1_29]|uniref:DUF202 domain-containing protein n=1 Tax=Lipingzhangella rawalii TaxID=2055835 RepID=A0ABU2H5C0_9ACTN|nr:DUF202 domain-containing protein [Lipingzhangella rawalii]MDS1270054.1 DUF202 domain-containing protein [Lipingzhangella rawalii]